MAEMLKRNDVAAVADSLLELKRQIDDGKLDATSAMRYRVDGAIAALEVILGASGDTIIELLLQEEGDTE